MNPPGLLGDERDRRVSPRAPLCTRALVVAEDGVSATEHITYDLSASGVRLCGLPRAHVGGQVGLLLCLAEEWVRATGELVRLDAHEENPQFAVRFTDMAAQAEDAIQDAVLRALATPQRHSVLLVRPRHSEGWPGWRWLEPVASACAVALTPLDAVVKMNVERIALGIVDPLRCCAIRPSAWRTSFPMVLWRTLDRAGRLGPVSTLH
jgi:hypothetical protein